MELYMLFMPILITAILVAYKIGYTSGEDSGFEIGRKTGQIEERTRNMRALPDINDIFLN